MVSGLPRGEKKSYVWHVVISFLILLSQVQQGYMLFWWCDERKSQEHLQDIIWRIGAEPTLGLISGGVQNVRNET